MNSNQNKNASHKRNSRDWFMILIVMFIALGIGLAIFNSGNSPEELTYNDFVSYESKGQITEMEATPVGSGGNAKLYQISGKYKTDENETKRFKIIISDEALNVILSNVQSGNAKYTFEYNELVIVDWLRII